MKDETDFKLNFLEKSNVAEALAEMAQNTSVDFGNGSQVRNGYMGLVIYIAKLLNEDDDFQMSDLCTDTFQDFLDGEFTNQIELQNNSEDLELV